MWRQNAGELRVPVLTQVVLSLLAALVIFFGCFPGVHVNALNDAIKLAGF